MTMTDHPQLREETALREAIARLCRRFPDRQASDVEVVVARRYAALADSRIRDFIPMLVERAAYNDLAHS